MACDAPLFSVAVCSFRRYDRLEKAVESVLAQQIEPEAFDLWIMDNSPEGDEKTAARLRYQGLERVHYVALDRPGLSAARNEAVRQSTGTYIVFLDDDAVAVPGWLAAFQSALEAVAAKGGAAVGGMGGRIVPDFEAPRPAWLDDRTVQFLSLADWGEAVHQLENERTPIGANMMLARKALDDCGVFPENLGRVGCGTGNLLSGEEIDVFQRLRAKEWGLYYAPDAEVAHFVPKERLGREWFRRRLAWQAISNQLREPMSAEKELPFWSHIVDFVRQAPREHAAFMGLFWDTEDPALFRKQTDCAHYLTQILIGSGCYPKEIAEKMKRAKKQ